MSTVLDPHARLWRSALFARLPALLRQHRPDGLYVSMPPFSMVPLAVELQRETGLPLVLDFRDNWSLFVRAPFPSWLHYRAVVAQERAGVRAATHTICATEGVREDLMRQHSLRPHQITSVLSGYDAPVGEWSIRPKSDDEGTFVIGYVGRFYYDPEGDAAQTRAWWRKPPHRMLQYTPRREEWLYRTPLFFFRAVRELITRRPELRARLRIRFVGEDAVWLQHQIDQTGVGEVVEVLGRMPHDQCIRFQQGCDALLSTSVKIPGGRDYCVAGKTFEYLQLRRPIVGFVAEGSQRDILARSGMAILCDPDDPGGSAQRLSDLIDGRIRPRPDGAYLDSLDARHQVERLAAVFRGSVRVHTRQGPSV